VIDEYVQGVTTQRFGLQPSKSATWIEEGVSSYVAYKAFKGKFPEFADQHLEQRQKVAFKFLIVGQFPHFRDISTRKVWYANIIKSWLTWNSQYAAAYMGVLYIVDHYGFDTVEQILAAVSRGVPYKDAMEDVLGLTLEEFETRVKLSIFIKGVSDLYFEYTILLLILVGLALLIVLKRMHARGGNLATRKVRISEHSSMSRSQQRPDLSELPYFSEQSSVRTVTSVGTPGQSASIRRSPNLPPSP
jgi:hypothetical protein